MRVVVASCWKYRDAWEPFFSLFKQFWPDCPYQVTLLTDYVESDAIPFHVADVSEQGEDLSWGQVLAKFVANEKAPILLLQEDFFLNAPVATRAIQHVYDILGLYGETDNVGAVRLYPCPGATRPSDHPYFGPVARHTAYRNSLQATVWMPEYLHAIASRYDTPREFEIQGSAWASAHLSAEVWAWKREIELWPIQYLCSAISRSKWNPDAKKLCDFHGIEVDWTMRPFSHASGE